MKKRSRVVVWSDSAAADLREPAEYIASQNAENLEAILKRLREKAEKLATFPERGRVMPELQQQQITNYRERIVTPWRLIYRIAGDKILVAAVIDGRRDFTDHLVKRVLRADRT